MSVPRTAAIVQSSYIPWKGYFDLIRQVDHFILYDDVQFTRRDWRNRNRIKTKDGIQWLTIPVQVRGRRDQRIRDVRIADSRWNRQHWTRIAVAYARAAAFKDYREGLEELYGRASSPWLTDVNRLFIDAICRWLRIDTPLSWSSDFAVSGNPTERLLRLCQHVGAGRYLSGPSARAYLETDLFAQAGVEVSYINYSGYREYPQVHPPFEHTVSAVDLLLNAGVHASEFLLPFSR